MASKQASQTIKTVIDAPNRLCMALLSRDIYSYLISYAQTATAHLPVLNPSARHNRALQISEDQRAHAVDCSVRGLHPSPAHHFFAAKTSSGF